MPGSRATTIQFFLPDGQPRGIRIAEITTRIVQAVVVPRTKLADADKRPELKSVGVYFLFGELEEAAKPVVYIGEAEDCYQRLKQHNQGKDFWQTAVVIVSKTGSFTKAHVKYLEWYCVQQASEVGRYSLENGNAPSKPFVTEPMEADLMDAYDTLNTLTAALGFPVLERIHRAAAKDTFHCTGRGGEGRGELVEDGFLVLKGSKAITTLTKSAGAHIPSSRNTLLASGILAEEDGFYVFTQDYLFRTPSGASGVIVGRSSNGWREWKDKNGKTLGEVKRPAAE